MKIIEIELDIKYCSKGEFDSNTLCAIIKQQQRINLKSDKKIKLHKTQNNVEF